MAILGGGGSGVLFSSLMQFLQEVHLLQFPRIFSWLIHVSFLLTPTA